MARIEVEGMQVHLLGTDQIALLLHRRGDVVRIVGVVRVVDQGPFEFTPGKSVVPLLEVRLAGFVHHVAVHRRTARDGCHDRNPGQTGQHQHQTPKRPWQQGRLHVFTASSISKEEGSAATAGTVRKLLVVS